VTGHALVVAKAPVAGRVKTRLGRVVGDEVAADLARQALLDTLAVCVATFGRARCLLALDGDLADGPGNAGIAEAVAGWTVFPQRGAGFAARLVAAHRDAAVALGPAVDEGVVQIGMDTPQLHPGHLLGLVAASGPGRVALGPAVDGGWWGLAHRDPACVDCLALVPMSTPETGRLTCSAIEASGSRVVLGPVLRDVDTLEDARAVGAQAPATRFADRLRRVREVAAR
jgi:hypothetical protein